MIVKTDQVPADCDYLTAGKLYDVAFYADLYHETFMMLDDDGDDIFCSFQDCAFLNGGDWEIVEYD